jgi:hypothetical protein
MRFRALIPAWLKTPTFAGRSWSPASVLSHVTQQFLNLRERDGEIL